MSIIEVYEKHKHLDHILSDPQFVKGSAIAYVAHELWLAIKEAAQAQQGIQADTATPLTGERFNELLRFAGVEAHE